METAILFILVLGLLFLGVPVAVSLGLSRSSSSPSFPTTRCPRWPAAVHRLAELHVACHSVLRAGIGVHVDRRRGQAHHPVCHCDSRSFPRRPGHGSVLACMLFAALSGSSPATVVAIGTIAIAGMRQVGYSKEFAAGVIANAGTLGILIPPSIVMVVYAAATRRVGRPHVPRRRDPGHSCRSHADDRDLHRGADQGSAS
jgi:C4-dicarboxylate transporter DctM subunit